MNNPILNFILLVLVILASSSGFFGKNLPRVVWWVSIASAVLLGFGMGIVLAPFPDSLYLGVCSSVGLVFIILVLRIPRRNQPR